MPWFRVQNWLSMNVLRPLMGLSIIALVIIGFVVCSSHQGSAMNTDVSRNDQLAYLRYAQSISSSDGAYIGERNRMPLFPYLLSTLHKFPTPAESDAALFKRCKNICIGVAALVLVGFFFLAKRLTSSHEAGIATLVAAVTVFVYKAPYIQADLLFYGLNLLLFTSALSLIKYPKAGPAVFTGGIAAIAHLTKASVMPCVILLAGCMLMKAIIRSRSGTAKHSESRLAAFRLFLRAVLPIFLLGLTYVGCLSPYLINSKRIYGRYWYNVNSTFYIWCDSWPEAVSGPRDHGDRLGWPRLPAEKIPSIDNYWKHHNFRDIALRLCDGMIVTIKTVSRSYGYAPFWLLYGSVALFVGIKYVTAKPRPLDFGDHAVTGAFIIGYFVGYAALYAWYVPIASGNRFVLSLFLPTLLCGAWATTRLRNEPAAGAGAFSPIPNIFLSATWGLLIIYLVGILPFQIGNIYGGD
jgi:hypothetical protein